MAKTEIRYVNRPSRYLVYLPSGTATDYWSFCAEKGCDWETELTNLSGVLDAPAILRFVPGAGSPTCAAGVELAAHPGNAVPADYVVCELPACDMVEFCSGPLADPSRFGEALAELKTAAECFDPKGDGYAFDPALAPGYNYGVRPDCGARMAFAVRRIAPK